MINSFFRSFLIAFSMYSRIPMPVVELKEEDMRYVFCWFPVIGIVIGAVEIIMYHLLVIAGAGAVFSGAVLMAVPVIITGGIHLDGFMDTVDARSSYGDRQRKLDILKDPHVGAFSVIWVSLYLIIYAGAWSELDFEGALLVCVGFVLERAFSGLAAINFKNARADGMLHTFSRPADRKIANFVLIIAMLGSVAAMLIINPARGLICAVLASVFFIYYRSMAMKSFGGITGDLEGWFLQGCELVVLLAAVASGFLGELLCVW